MTLLAAIAKLEAACLSADSKRTTQHDLEDNGCQSCFRYLQWLKLQTNVRVPAWENLTNKPQS